MAAAFAFGADAAPYLTDRSMPSVTAGFARAKAPTIGMGIGHV
jgi:hypothetical protein